MRVDFSDYKQELTCFLIGLLKNIELSKFKADDSDSLNRYISVCLKHKYYSIAKSINEERQNVARGKNNDILEVFFSRPSMKLETSFEKSEFFDALNCLSEKQKNVIICKYTYGFSDVEIGEMFNISRMAVNRLKNRAFETLKKYYDLE